LGTSALSCGNLLQSADSTAACRLDDPGFTRFRISEWRPPIITTAWMNKFGKWQNAKNAGLI